MYEGDGTAMWGEPRVAAECTYTERKVSRCARLEGVRGHGHGDDRLGRPYGRSSMQAGPSRRSTAPAIVSESMTFAVFVRAVTCRAEEACVITQGPRVEQSSATRPASPTAA